MGEPGAGAAVVERRPASRPLFLLALVLCLVAPTACGLADAGPVPAGPPASGLPGAGSSAAADVVHVFFSSTVGLERVSRAYRGPDAPQAAMDRLVAGPDQAERTRGLISFIPSGVPAPSAVVREPGTADVYLPPGWTTNPTALRQLVCTAADAVARTHRIRPDQARVRLHRSRDEEAETQTCAAF